MDRQNAFKSWLEQGGAQTPTGRNSRAYAIRTIERNLRALGMPYAHLDEAWNTDRFAALRERLKQVRDSARNGGQDYRLLMPDSDNPHNRLANWGSWLGQYGRFLAGDPPGAGKDADRIRQYVLEHYLEPAREEGQKQVKVLVSDVNSALGLNQAWPNICQALAGRMFQDLAKVPAPVRIGADQSSATVFSFDIAGLRINRAALETYRRKFLSHSPDFTTFVEPGTGWAKSEKAYKVVAIERVESVLANGASEEHVGREVFEVLKTASKDGPLVRWQTADTIGRTAADLLPEFYSTIGQLVQSDATTETALSAANSAFEALRIRGATSLTYGERINVLTSALAMVRPLDMAPLKITRINEAWETLTGEKLFVEASADIVADYRRFSEGFLELFEIMRDEWHWEPQDSLDIQGFLWIAIDKTVSVSQQPDSSADNSENTEKSLPNSPTNLILYGPPGTGKTYATAFEAVRLCDSVVSGDRAAVMARYRELVDANQVRFVTFHQSYSYEEFVEGLRPETDNDEDDEKAGAGFSLRPHRGIFREHCAIADQGRNTGISTKDFDFSNRNFFKMSLGRSGGDDSIYDAAIEGGFISIGWGDDVDWSDKKYVDYNEIFKKWNEVEPGTNGNSGHISQVWRFRSMKPGDIVIVSDGNSHFRAIGEVSSDYVFDSTGASEYRHSRKVIWHKVLDQSLPVETVYSDNFTMRTCYLLKENKIKKDALVQFIGSNTADTGNATPTQFVLIIDEINRANISKVFGELITLIEPDKRLGSENALQVRLPYSNELFGVPSNLHIIGTMNTADRSIALLDTALRRRFEFREIMPKPDLLNPDLDRVNLQALLRTINERIEYLFDREHQIGHAYFINCNSRAEIDQVMQHKVIPLLAEYFYEDWQKVALVLGDANGEGRFIERKELKAPPGLDSYGESEIRYRWQVRSTFADSAYEAFQ